MTNQKKIDKVKAEITLVVKSALSREVKTLAIKHLQAQLRELTRKPLTGDDADEWKNHFAVHISKGLNKGFTLEELDEMAVEQLAEFTAARNEK